MTMVQVSPRAAPTRNIYLDSQGTERPRPEVMRDSMAFWGESFGNPSALAHERGRAARRVVEGARAKMAESLGAEAEGVVFTSGATEANNLVIGAAPVPGRGRQKVVVSSFEHKSVLEAADRLTARGMTVLLAPVGPTGIVDMDRLRGMVDGRTSIVSVMLANNEVGTLQPIPAIATMCREAGVLLHVDAAQAVGKVEVDFRSLGADFMTVTAHKYGGPQGIGALVAQAGRLRLLQPQIVGGGQEGGMRAGTIPVALCHAMGLATQRAVEDLSREQARIRVMRDRLLAGLCQAGPFSLNGDLDRRLAGNINGGFNGVAALRLMRLLPDLHFAMGSACTTGNAGSHVLAAMGLGAERQSEAFRLSLGWSITEDDIDYTIARFQAVVPGLLPRRAGA